MPPLPLPNDRHPMTLTPDLVRRGIDVVGVVQGVGFRPYVTRLAHTWGLSGWVQNTGDGVRIEVQGHEPDLERFRAELVAQAPPLARIEQTRCETLAPTSDIGFLIRPSLDHTASQAVVPPDTATCDECLTEMWDPRNRRYRHPFITCTNCGPRWTIVTGLPYDRPRTTMADFVMCDACADEYCDPKDRRHHAQPIACHDCGPVLHRVEGTKNVVATSDIAAPNSSDEIVAATQNDLAAGQIVALKGLGGFHLVADATNDRAVARLRRKKSRPDKPFAIMVKDLATAREIAEVSDEEADLLCSPARPIVLLRAKRSDRFAVSMLVAPHSPVVGVMLPYTPVHHLLFEATPGHDSPVPSVLVMTSGNIAGEPIVHLDHEAFDTLAPLADTFCTHNRPIAVPCDDSVVKIIDGHESPVRRSRGYAPLSIRLPFDVPPLLAMGGDLKNTCCVASGDRAILSQHLGDMGSFATHKVFEQTSEALAALHGIEPEVVVADRHPGYHTTVLARRHHLDMISVGHHHAHLASVMAEHGIAPATTIMGFTFDGTGWGDDDTLWGGELLVGSYAHVERRAHLAPVCLPGGEAAVRNPWRMALAYLAAANVDAAGLAPSKQSSPEEHRVVEHQISTGLMSPATSSMGRLFDAVASLLDIRHTISHEAQAAIELEVAASQSPTAAEGMTFDLDSNLGPGVIDPRPVIRAIASQLRSGVSAPSLAAGFHDAVATCIVTLAIRQRAADDDLTIVGLTGGVFQNDYLTRRVSHQLRDNGFDVLTHRLVPANDGGLALGQAAVAGYRRNHPMNHPTPSRGGI